MAATITHETDTDRIAALEARLNERLAELDAAIQAVASGAGHFFEAGRESVLCPRPSQPARPALRVVTG